MEEREEKVVWLPVDEVKPYENNPRINDGAVQATANSIKEFGFRAPILVDKDHVIIAGHTRLKAAQLLGLEKVKCIICDDLPPEKVRAYRIADNKTGGLAAWDDSKLEKEITDILAELPGLDFTDLGFGENELANLLGNSEYGGGVTDAQTIKEGQELSTDSFGDDQFTCECPRCGFKFNA